MLPKCLISRCSLKILRFSPQINVNVLLPRLILYLFSFFGFFSTISFNIVPRFLIVPSYPYTIFLTFSTTSFANLTLFTILSLGTSIFIFLTTSIRDPEQQMYMSVPRRLTSMNNLASICASLSIDGQRLMQHVMQYGPTYLKMPLSLALFSIGIRECLIGPLLRPSLLIITFFLFFNETVEPNYLQLLLLLIIDLLNQTVRSYQGTQSWKSFQNRLIFSNFMNVFCVLGRQIRRQDLLLLKFQIFVWTIQWLVPDFNIVLRWILMFGVFLEKATRDDLRLTEVQVSYWLKISRLRRQSIFSTNPDPLSPPSLIQALSISSIEYSQRCLNALVSTFLNPICIFFQNSFHFIQTVYLCLSILLIIFNYFIVSLQHIICIKCFPNVSSIFIMIMAYLVHSFYGFILITVCLMLSIILISSMVTWQKSNLWWKIRFFWQLYRYWLCNFKKFYYTSWCVIGQTMQEFLGAYDLTMFSFCSDFGASWIGCVRSVALNLTDARLQMEYYYLVLITWQQDQKILAEFMLLFGDYLKENRIYGRIKKVFMKERREVGEKMFGWNGGGLNVGVAGQCVSVLMEVVKALLAALDNIVGWWLGQPIQPNIAMIMDSFQKLLVAIIYSTHQASNPEIFLKANALSIPSIWYLIMTWHVYVLAPSIFTSNYLKYAYACRRPPNCILQTKFNPIFP